MRRVFWLPMVIFALLLGACGDATGVGGRSLDGDWLARVEGEEVWLRLDERNGRISGNGEWGFDQIYVSGERFGSDVYLLMEFSQFSPIEFEGRIFGSELEGYVVGSGFNGQSVTFWRER